MKKVIIALPGTEFSEQFMLAWTDTLLHLTKQGYNVAVISGFSDNKQFSRMNTIGIDIKRGKDQKPFDGKIEYDVWLTIDSNILFTPKHVVELIEDTDKYPIVSAVYRVNQNDLSAISNIDDELLVKHGSYPRLTKEMMDPNIKHVKVAATDLGMIACRRDALESIQYPHFFYPLVNIKTDEEEISSIVSDSMAFCMKARDAGLEITINTDVMVGNQQKIIM